MAKKLITDRERFLRNINIDANGCWIWRRAKEQDGYGIFRIGSRADKSRKQVRAHRWAYEEFIRPIPAGLQIDHLCRVRHCVNPQHLEVVTGEENTRRGWRANKTHCDHGHPLSGNNLYTWKDGKRGCRTCRIKRATDFRNRRRLLDMVMK